MKKLLYVVVGAIFTFGLAQTGLAQCSGGSCKPILNKKQRKQIQSVQNDIKRQAWVKERQQHWKNVAQQKKANQAKYQNQLLLQQKRLAGMKR